MGAERTIDGSKPESVLPKATTATARQKILIQYYRLVVNGIQYVDPGEEQYNERFRNQRIRSLTKKQAGKLGMKLIDAAGANSLPRIFLRREEVRAM